jgi:sugar lactone lactonase YvrE
MGVFSVCSATPGKTAVCPDDIAYQRGYSGRTLACGATLHSANGMYFDSNDLIHIANLLSHEIHTVDPDTGDVIATIGPEDGVMSPDDCTVGPGDVVYWTGFLTGLVGRQLPTGDVDTIAELPPGLNGLTFSDDGLLYVNNYMNGQIYEVDPEGVLPPRTVAYGPPGLEAMDIGPDGHLYTPSFVTGSIYQVNIATGEMTEILTGYPELASLKFDSSGTMYVAQAAGTMLTMVDPASGEAEVFAEFDSEIETIAFDSQDRLFVSDAAEGHLYRVDADGSYESILRPGLVVGGGLGVVVRGLRVSLFVADVFSMKEYSPLLGRLRQTWLYGAADPLTQLQNPFTASAYGKDEVLVTSWFGNAVQVWDPQTNTISQSHLDFAVPLNAIEVAGDIVVAEVGTGTVSVRPAGTSERNVIAEGLYVPAGLAANWRNDVWVSDWASGVIWQVMANGAPIAATPVAEGLVYPEGMAVGGYGTLIVVETGTQRLVEVDPATGAIATIATNLPVGIPPVPEVPPTWVFNGVAIDPFGAIYVSLDAQNKLLKVWPPYWGG